MDDSLFLQDHCQFKVRFDLSRDENSKIIESQIFYFSKLISQGKELQIIPRWNEDLKTLFPGYNINQC